MKKIFFLVLILFINIIKAQNVGLVDSTFNYPNKFNLGFLGGVSTLKVRQNGKILVGGNLGQYNETKQKYIAQLNTDGKLDTTFNSINDPNKLVRSIAIQSNGKILIAGDFDSCGSFKTSNLVRLNANATLDNTFTCPHFSGGSVSNITIQSDENILVSAPNIFRIDSTGKIDSTFLTNRGTGANNSIYTVALQNDGKIILGGIFTSFNGITCNEIVRLNANGTYDSTFTVSGVPSNARVHTIAVQLDGKILVGGDWYSSGSTRACIARLNIDGSKDTTFSASFNNVVRTIHIQTNNKIIVAGSFSSYKNTYKVGICRLNVDGSLDSSYSNGIGIDSKAFDPINFGIYSIENTNDSNTVIAGSFVSYNRLYCGNIAKIDSLGNFDPKFNSTKWANGPVYKMVVQKDDKVIIGGFFSRYNDIAVSNLARLNADGSLDNSFNHSNSVNAEVVSIALQTDGKVIFGGYFNKFNNISCSGIIRLNPDGSLDNTFSFNDTVIPYAITVQQDGKILIGNFLGSTTKYLLRLNSNGSRDSTFNSSGSGANFPVRSISLQPDNKILIGGDFTSYNGVSRKRIARLHQDGSIDTTFTPFTINGNFPTNFVNEISVLPNGKIIAVGAFSYNLSGPKSGVIQLLSNGSIDSAFNIGTGAKDYLGNNAGVNTLKCQSDGKIVIGGDFSLFNGYYLSGLARLMPNGEFDTIFNQIGRGTIYVYSIDIQSNNKLLAAGNFRYYNDFVTGSLIRLYNDNNDSISLGLKQYSENQIKVYPNPFQYSITIESENIENSLVMVVDLQGNIKKEFQISYSGQTIYFDDLASGFYIIKFKTKDNKEFYKKIICVK